MKKRIVIISIFFIAIVFGGVWIYKNYNFNDKYEVGFPVDSLNGVYVYYNGGVDNVSGRNLGEDGYNLGLKYQCVEFVKRYYYEYLDHEMPETYGHAKDFFDPMLEDGEYNKQRDLYQFANPSKVKPAVNDLLIFSGTLWNRFGHVAIVSDVRDDHIEIIQQNPGPYGKSRETYPLTYNNGFWQAGNQRILGWLRKIKIKS